MIKHKHVAIPISVFIAGYFAEMLANIFIARWLGADLYGDFAVAYRAISLAAMVVLIGSASCSIRFIPHYYQQQQWAHLKGFLLHHIRIILIACVCLFALLTLYFTGKFVGYKLIRLRPIIDHPFIFALLITPLFAFNLFFASILTSLKHPFWSGMTSKVLSHLFLVILLAALAYELKFISLFLAFAMVSVAYTIVIIVQLILLYRYFPRSFSQTQQTIEPAKWNRVILALFISTVFYTLSNQINLYMVEILHDNENIVGYFSAVLLIASSLWLPRNAAGLIYNPAASSLLGAHNKKELQVEAFKSSRTISPITFVTLIIICIFTKPLLHLFGPEYGIATWPLIITSIAMSVKSTVILAEPILKYSGNERANLYAQASSLILNIILSLLLIPKYGLYGASISLLISRSSLSFTQFYLAKRRLGINTFLF